MYNIFYNLILAIENCFRILTIFEKIYLDVYYEPFSIFYQSFLRFFPSIKMLQYIGSHNEVDSGNSDIVILPRD